MQNNQRDNDLQRAIDEITKKTAAAGAPRPVQGAAPSAPAAVPTAGMPPAMGQAATPANSATFATPTAPVAPAAPVAPKPVEAPKAPAAPKPSVEVPKKADTPRPVVAPKPVIETRTPKPEIKTPEINKPAGEKKVLSGDIQAVKEAALKDLFPLMDKINVSADKRFDLYKDMIDTIDNKEVFAPALDAANGLKDKTDRANAILHVINSIDDLGN